MTDINLEALSQIDPLNIRIELFKKRDFSFIVEGENEDGKIVAHEKQRLALEILTSNLYKEFLFGGAAGGSKILENNGVILTPLGWKKGKDLKVGDLVSNPDGSVQRIIAIKPEIHVDKWRVSFRDGTYTDVGREHLWNAWKGRKGRKINNKRVFGEESAEVIETHTLKTWIDRGYTPQIPVCKPQKFNRTSNEKNRIDPYLLGVLLGDGCLSGKSIAISSCSDDLNHYCSQFGNLDYSIGKDYISFKSETDQWLKKKLSLHNLLGTKSKNKFIPETYKWASVNDRFSIVQGLMDTDGTSSKKKNACYFTSISKKLADDVAFIIRSLGGIVTINKNKAGYKKDGTYIQCNDAYELYIRIENPDRLFRLKRKHNGIFGKNLVQKAVSKVEVVGKIKGRCITVSNPNGLYVTNDFIVTHNSWTGCTWTLFMALAYPHTKYFIARNELKDILDSVYVTWNKVCRRYGYDDFNFNAQKNFIQLGNGSHINFIELKYKPSDPMYEDVGSTEYTAGWIEEVGEIHEMAATVIASRVGRHLNKRDHNGKLRETPIKGVVFYTGNPKKNWTKRDFYDKWKKGKLEEHKRYLGCLVTDNPFIESEYIENLQNLADKNKAIYERLFKGNWDYEDNENALCKYEMIEQVFSNDHVAEGSKYITADVARFGSDKAVIGVWSGWQLIDIRTFDISKTTDIEYLIRLLRRKYQIPKNRCIADQDGVGGGVVDGAGIIGFTNNARPIKEKGKKDQPNYKNIQVQCMYHLSDKVNEGGIWINADISYQEKEHIKEELDQIQSKNSDERKLECKSKSDIKQDIGRSPDYRDMLLMRVYFDLKDRKPKFMRSRERKVV